MKQEYIEFAIASFLRTKEFNAQVGDAWIPEEAYESLANAAVLSAFKSYGFEINPASFRVDFDKIFEAFVASGAVVYDGDDFAGNWFKLEVNTKNAVIDQIIANNSGSARAQRLGPQALERALRAIVADIDGPTPNAGVDPSIEIDAVSIPASDRIVRLDHNQSSEFDVDISNLVDQLEGQDNGDPDHPGLRERLLGQLKAGRELIRAGEFRAYLLYEVLVRALGELIDKYGNPTIKAMANALLGAVISKILEG